MSLAKPDPSTSPAFFTLYEVRNKQVRQFSLVPIQWNIGITRIRRLEAVNEQRPETSSDFGQVKFHLWITIVVANLEGFVVSK